MKQDNPNKDLGHSAGKTDGPAKSNTIGWIIAAAFAVIIILALILS